MKILKITTSTPYQEIQKIRCNHFYSLFNSFDCQPIIDGLHNKPQVTKLWVNGYLDFLLGIEKISPKKPTNSFMEEIVSAIFFHIIKNNDQHWHNLFMSKDIKQKMQKMAKKIYAESQLNTIPINPTLYTGISPFEFINKTNIYMFNDWKDIYIFSLKTQTNKNLAFDCLGFNFSDETKNNEKSLAIYNILMQNIPTKSIPSFNQGILESYHIALMEENCDKKIQYGRSYSQIIKHIYSKRNPSLWDMKEITILSHKRNYEILNNAIKLYSPTTILLWMCRLFNKKQRQNKHKLNALLKNINTEQNKGINMNAFDNILIELLTNHLINSFYPSIKKEIIENLQSIPKTKSLLWQHYLNKEISLNTNLYTDCKIKKI